jgi:hypothetical protein
MNIAGADIPSIDRLSSQPHSIDLATDAASSGMR